MGTRSMLRVFRAACYCGLIYFVAVVGIVVFQTPLKQLYHLENLAVEWFLIPYSTILGCGLFAGAIFVFTYLIEKQLKAKTVSIRLELWCILFCGIGIPILYAVINHLVNRYAHSIQHLREEYITIYGFFHVLIAFFSPFTLAARNLLLAACGISIGHKRCFGQQAVKKAILVSLALNALCFGFLILLIVLQSPLRFLMTGDSEAFQDFYFPVPEVIQGTFLLLIQALFSGQILRQISAGNPTGILEKVWLIPVASILIPLFSYGPDPLDVYKSYILKNLFAYSFFQNVRFIYDYLSYFAIGIFAAAYGLSLNYKAQIKSTKAAYD